MKNSQLIKRNTNAGGYTKIYPLAYIQGIIDSNTGECLTNILQAFNNIYLPYLGSVEETRLSLPSFYRRTGIIITYFDGSNVTTEIYKGSTDLISNDAIFANDANWEIIPDIEYVQSNASKIPDGAILPKHLSSTLQELLGSNNTINNFPDEEDLTQDCHVLSFKDRDYNPDNASGLGYKILRKNWVDSRNILTQDMINDSNTIYEVRYDFDLNGQNIEIPEGSILSFKGGSFNNGIIIYNNRIIDASNIIYSAQYFDAESGRPIWWNGTSWVDATGAEI